MIYEIRLRSGWYKDGILDLYPPHVIDMMEASQVEKVLGIDCDVCPLACHCHVLEKVGAHRYRKLCTVLFHDMVKPEWKIEEVV